jgi:hypothetical protein
LLSGQRWRAGRLGQPPLAAYCWNGASPIHYRVRDISETGFYLITKERWCARTMLMLTLQSGNYPDRGAKESIMVQAMVIRCGPDGVGLAFVPSDVFDCRRGDCILAHGADKATLQMFLRRLRAARPHSFPGKSTSIARCLSPSRNSDER